MKSILKPPSPFDSARAARPVPGLRTTGIALLGSMLCIGAAETLIGSLDQADDVAALAEGAGRLSTGGMLLLLAAILLGVFVAGVGRVVWPSLLGRVGWVLLVIAVPCGGAFAMFHLTMVEVGAPGLDAAAMEEFIIERFQGPGLWGAPVGYFAVVGLMSVLLVLIALARVRVCPVAAPVLFVLGMALEAFLGDGGTEVGSHWVMAAAAAIASYGLWQAGRPSRNVISTGVRAQAQ